MQTVKQVAFNKEKLIVKSVKPEKYQGACIRACYKLSWNRYENVKDWAKYCLVPYCHINSDGQFDVDYDTSYKGSV